MIAVRRARPADAPGIGAVHVAAWQSAYPGILPSDFLARMSVARQAAHYEATIRAGGGVHVAMASGLDVPEGAMPRLVGFATSGPARWSDVMGRRLADGEIETLYVLDDWHERGLGRRLVRAAAASLLEAGCRTLFLWVLRDNPSRWFYERLGGRAVADATIMVGGRPVVQTAFVWDPIEKLLEQSARAR
ncbi:MAG TPA: GNAT family N-acetyltransferase [Acetobacteraceae bacterium]|nr:GNAT family N-acetyltransferase [Acetobacteraceae bacterium]